LAWENAHGTLKLLCCSAPYKKLGCWWCVVVLEAQATERGLLLTAFCLGGSSSAPVACFKRKGPWDTTELRACEKLSPPSIGKLPPSIPAASSAGTAPPCVRWELYAVAQKPEGQITEVSYMFPRPGADKTPVPKVTFVTKVSDLGCAVGYYK